MYGALYGIYGLEAGAAPASAGHIIDMSIIIVTIATITTIAIIIITIATITIAIITIPPRHGASPAVRIGAK